jgi:hypothetical protein
VATVLNGKKITPGLSATTALLRAADNLGIAHRVQPAIVQPLAGGAMHDELERQPEGTLREALGQRRVIAGDQLLLLMEADHSLGYRLMKQLNALITGNLTAFASG